MIGSRILSTDTDKIVNDAAKMNNAYLQISTILDTAKGEILEVKHKYNAAFSNLVNQMDVDAGRSVLDGMIQSHIDGGRRVLI